MPAVADALPTGPIYGVHQTQETRVEPLPGRDVGALVRALRHDPIEHTTVTPGHMWLVGALTDSPYDVVAWTSAGALVVMDVKVYEATPSAIEDAYAEARTLAAPEPDPPAYTAFKSLGRWLDADDATIADMVGIGRTTPYTWKRDGREPRATTAQRIYEFHATLDSLRRRLGAVGLRRWLHEGIPPRRETLLAGDLESLDFDVHALLFRRESGRRVDLGAAPEDLTLDEAVRSDRPLRPSGRRPRRS
jgi:hypothetical protein